MSRYLTVFGILLAGWSMACEGQQTATPQGRIRITDDLEIERIGDNVWRHISYENLESFGRSPGNGLVVVAGDEAVLLDTPWRDEQTAALFDWARDELGARITTVVVTHSHPDNLGGLGEAHRRGSRSIAYEKTVEFARENGRVVPQLAVDTSYDLSINDLHLELRFYGAGHTADNIVVWLPQENILFGGCLVRSATTRILGYTDEADLESWPETIRRVLEQYGNQEPIVVPGHGPPGGIELLRHTLELLGEQEHGEGPALDR
jgi:metallo-beta-lactamase class B